MPLYGINCKTKTLTHIIFAIQFNVPKQYEKMMTKIKRYQKLKF